MTQMDADDVGTVRERVWTAPRCTPPVPARQMNADERRGQRYKELSDVASMDNVVGNRFAVMCSEH